MKRTAISQTLIAMALMPGGSATAFAHNGIEHVLGTVKQLTATSVTVETVQHKMTAIALDPTTAFSSKGVQASAKDLKVGERVAIDTRDDASDKPHAITVRWGATLSARKTTAGKATSGMDPRMKM